MRKFILLLCFFGGFSFVAISQRVAVKANVVEWATLSPHIGAEFVFAPRWSFDVGFSGNFGNPTAYKIKNVKVQPELRYWFGRPMVRHFFGLTSFYTSYDTRFKETNRYGDAAAVGLSYGYDFVLDRHWGLELTAGVGAIRYRQFKYAAGESKPAELNDKGWAFAPVKVGISFFYIVK